MKENKSQPEETPKLPVSEQEVQIEAPTLLDKLKIQKKKILVGVGCFFGVLAITGITLAAYLISRKQVYPEPAEGPTPLPTEAQVKEGDPTANWKTYQNENVTFKFPSEWTQNPILVRGSGFSQEFEDPKGKFSFTFSI